MVPEAEHPGEQGWRPRGKGQVMISVESLLWNTPNPCHSCVL